MGALPRGWQPFKFWASTFQWTHPRPQGDLKASHRDPDPTAISGASPQTLDWPPCQAGSLAHPQPTGKCPGSAPGRAASVSAECPEGLHVHWGSGQKTCASVCFLVAAQQPGHFLETCGDEGLDTLPGTPYPPPFSPTMVGNPCWPCPQGHHHVHRAWLPTWRCCRQQAWQRRKSQEGHLKKTTSSALQPAHATPAARGLM